MLKKLLILSVILLAGVAGNGEAQRLNLVFKCASDNDLYRVLARSGQKCPRYDTASEAVERAKDGSAVLILADGYSDTPTQIMPAVFETAARKKLRLYVEYPASIPGVEIGAPQGIVWERAIVSSDTFGDALPKLRILTINDCRYIPVSAPNPMIVIARVAGYDTAVYGIPESAQPIFFEVPDRNLLIATTKLSNFVTARYAPAADWKVVWESILAKLDPECRVDLEWTPDVRPAYGPSDKLPADVEKRALGSAAEWIRNSRLLIHASDEPAIHEMLRRNAESRPVPGPDHPVGDGSLGILEGYASAIRSDGSQLQRVPIRSDCNAEVAMVLALDWALNRNERSRDAAKNLLDYIYFTSGMCGGVRGDPKHPAFGLIAWGNISPAWEVANYGDDDARVMLGTMIVSECLGSDRWDERVLRALLANLRTTGTLGFRGDRIDIPQIESLGWKHFHDAATVNIAPHFESYLWACNLWAYRQTRYKPFLEKTRTAIRMTMEAYPDGWRWQDSIERARMLLCLAWLVRLEDTAEHREWLRKVAYDLLTLQQPCGAIAERVNEGGGAGHYWAPRSNEAYGTSETPLIQQNGDPASDQLYTTPFALLALHEAYAATADPKLKEAEDRLAEFLCRIQIRSDKYPYLNGAWFRAFDFKRWDYWASSADAGWGAWSVESGWGTAWAAAVMGLRAKGISFWDFTSGSKIIEQFRKVHGEMVDG
jgi:hypothetical protein